MITIVCNRSIFQLNSQLLCLLGSQTPLDVHASTIRQPPFCKLGSESSSRPLSNRKLTLVMLFCFYMRKSLKNVGLNCKFLASFGLDRCCSVWKRSSHIYPLFYGHLHLVRKDLLYLQATPVAMCFKSGRWDLIYCEESEKNPKGPKDYLLLARNATRTDDHPRVEIFLSNLFKYEHHKVAAESVYPCSHCSW